MTKLVTTVIVLIVGAAVLSAVAPTIAKLVSSLTVPIIAAGLIACLVRIVWSVTGRW